MKKVFLFAAAALALAACNNDNYSESPVAARISATIGENAFSRASGKEWAKGDEIGITTTFKSQTGPFINMKYTTAEGDGAFDGKTIYIYNPMSLTAYYPFADKEGAAPGNAGIVTAVTNAEYQTEDNQPKIDFLYAVKENITSDSPKIVLDFSHKMSKLTFVFKNGSGSDVSKISSYKIDGLILDGTFDTATGVCAAKNDAAVAALAIDAVGVKTGDALPSLILFPQSTRNKEVKLIVTDDEEQVYTCNLSFSDNVLAPGNNYLYTITVNKTGLSIDSSTIIDWNVEKLEGDANSQLF